ncbi:MAG TPA: RagB/SusD family nutrient uptake outer membrane protein [Chitinophagaceae bacterium]|nr:RagB/SusD family nutrient uptake outer membrane protein [Chitinophagaceae bacterium]
MERKNFIVSCSKVALLAVIAGCKKTFLDQENNSAAVQQSQYFTTVAQCDSSTAVCYNDIDWGSWWQTFNWRFLAGEAASDNAWVSNTYQSHPTYDQVAGYTLNSGNDRLESQWIELYKGIGIFNSTMEGIQGSPVKDADKAKFIAELKFLRAYCYFRLVRNFGGVPIILQVYPPDTHLPRNTIKEVYEQIVTDLKACAEVLPRKSAYSAVNKFRASQGAALALLAKVYLYMEDWPNAEATAKQVITLGDYTLESGFGDLWDYNYKNGPESIFEIQHASSLTPSLPACPLIILNARADGGWGYYGATSDLENAYLAEKDDIRREWTINKQGEPVVGDPDNPSFDSGGYPEKSSKSGRFSRKWYVPKAQRPANNLYARDNILLRLGDIILVHAEACAMQQKTGDALGSLKMIRDRVQLPTDMSLTGWDLINAVRKERRLETAFEGERLFDIRRWKDQSGTPVINSIMGPNGSFVTYNTKVSTDYFETNNKVEPQDEGIHFDPAKHLLWPIPNSQVVVSGGVVKQNPGY